MQANINQHQALALVNRWAKLKHYWFPDDRDSLYRLKADLIAEWVGSGAIVPVKVIQRHAPTIEAMQLEIANGGSRLELLDWSDRDVEIESSSGYSHWRLLDGLANDTIAIPLSAIESARAESAYQLELAEYQQGQAREYQRQLAEYQINVQQYAVLKREYDRLWAEFKLKLAPYLPQVKAALAALLKAQKRSKRGSPKSLKKCLHLLEASHPIPAKSSVQFLVGLLKQQGIRIPSVKLILNPPIQVQAPKQVAAPPRPRLFKDIEASAYIRGSDPQVEAAIEWAQLQLNRSPLDIPDIDDNLVNFELLDILVAEALEDLRVAATMIFEQIVNEEIDSARSAHALLSSINLDYSEAIGTPSQTQTFITRRNQQPDSAAKFTRWHEANLTVSGRWSIAFVSKIDSSITFQLPYDRAIAISAIKTSRLPTEFCSRSSAGREITEQEKADYPIADLTAFLGKDAKDFPSSLRRYYRSGFDDFDDFDDFDLNYFGE